LIPIGEFTEKGCNPCKGCIPVNKRNPDDRGKYQIGGTKMEKKFNDAYKDGCCKNEVCFAYELIESTRRFDHTVDMMINLLVKSDMTSREAIQEYSYLTQCLEEQSSSVQERLYEMTCNQDTSSQDMFDEIPF
jgi:hypothetical protein